MPFSPDRQTHNRVLLLLKVTQQGGWVGGSSCLASHHPLLFSACAPIPSSTDLCFQGGCKGDQSLYVRSVFSEVSTLMDLISSASQAKSGS